MKKRYHGSYLAPQLEEPSYKRSKDRSEAYAAYKLLKLFKYLPTYSNLPEQEVHIGLNKHVQRVYNELISSYMPYSYLSDTELEQAAQIILHNQHDRDSIFSLVASEVINTIHKTRQGYIRNVSRELLFQVFESLGQYQSLQREDVSIGLENYVQSIYDELISSYIPFSYLSPDKFKLAAKRILGYNNHNQGNIFQKVAKETIETIQENRQYYHMSKRDRDREREDMHMRDD